MKKLSKKQKEWNLSKSRKQMRNLSRQKRRKKTKYRGCVGVKENFNGHKQHKIYAPKVMSLVEDNDQNTLDFFGYAVEIIQRCKIKEEIYFELYDIENVTADAIMYVIALINNYKRINMLKIHVSGNLPHATDAKIYFEDIGFYSYVRGLRSTHPMSDERFRISQGEGPDAPLVGKICDFVISKVVSSYNVSTKRLYPMIIELMTNTCQHAYKKELSTKMKSNWYIFAENKEDNVHFVFLDTGAGIPTTIRYTLFEKGANLFERDDASYIESALKGENRTETKQRHRGKGLPGIYEDAKQGKVNNLTIISGKGRCDILQNGEVKKTSLNKNFEGTLFAWDFKIA